MKESKEIAKRILAAEKIVITSHKSPDGDSIGSSLGLLNFIIALGKQAQICHPDPSPAFLDWAIEGTSILDYENNPDQVTKAMKEADLIFCLDYNGSGRLGKEMGEILLSASGSKIMIDHHLDPETFADILVSEPNVCSTSQLIFELIESSGNISLLNKSIGTPLYLGMMTDTGSFRYSSVNARTHEVLAELLRAGVDHTSVHENTFDGNRLDQLKLRAHIIAQNLELNNEFGIAIITVTEDELKRFNYIKGDTEGLVNVALSIVGVKAAAFFTEQNGVVKISFRSKGDIAVNEIAENFDGGGHKFAAGGISEESLNDTVRKFKKLLPKYF